MKNLGLTVEKAEKENEAVEGQFTILESEKSTLAISLEAFALAASKKERLINVAKAELEEKLA